MVRKSMPLGMTHLVGNDTVAAAKGLAHSHHQSGQPHDEQHVEAPKCVKRQKPVVLFHIALRLCTLEAQNASSLGRRHFLEDCLALPLKRLDK